MIDITHKSNSYRMATAQARVTVSKQETISAIENDKVPKGNVFEMSRAAGLLAVKRTPEILPDCHPLPIEFTGITYEIERLDIIISCTIKTIYKTGVEVEAMHGASVVALNLYDMLKPIDKGIEINNIKLLSKKGGKSDYKLKNINLTAAVIVCSDSISRGDKEDRAGKEIMKNLKTHHVLVKDYTIIPDNMDIIREKLKEHGANGTSMVIYTGGTGLSPRDLTPEALAPLLDNTIPGIEETIRRYGQERTGYAMLSRSVAGMIGNTLVLALPGSTAGARESMQAVFPAVLHLFDIIKGSRH
ncbi:MAG: bifunctional molybdenum cofactor biosynthesis protein MoaC/MoaB [Bacteroidia bacterium]|nr:bifunctional molybdenum cofactor biosynthesis protein MoaC/MoaB [Bacteroidia bacterium]MBT8309059.1 bifunctional molybdenum cofactor biosynthesis protein MoaC/MoaB [Bacteroidia bacterium]NND11969.1 bifunctional molybdenum cofactor biosynthesis protein MoaC/MoaB [Flavobacteriaceae bacterium]NNK26969.1 bifunctional molybdenum cofactor biosynthesis protein MoaC/MoaB [Flavobacteriaceae bacterium]NNL61060.1 bifunctional molybdenum cofactor biosynthesis protein MoaC/MoaB [Flavobacteriaceae bacteri